MEDKKPPYRKYDHYEKDSIRLELLRGKDVIVGYIIELKLKSLGKVLRESVDIIKTLYAAYYKRHSKNEKLRQGTEE